MQSEKTDILNHYNHDTYDNQLSLKSYEMEIQQNVQYEFSHDHNVFVKAQHPEQHENQPNRKSLKKNKDNFSDSANWLSKGDLRPCKTNFDYLFYFLNLENERKSIIITDCRGVILYANKSASELYEGSLSCFNAHTIDEYVISCQRQSFRNCINEHMGKGIAINYLIYSKGSRRKYANICNQKNQNEMDIYFRYLKCLKTTANPINLTFNKNCSLEGNWNKNLFENYQGEIIQCFVFQSWLGEDYPELSLDLLLKDSTLKKFIQITKNKNNKEQCLGFGYLDQFKDIFRKNIKEAGIKKNKINKARKEQKKRYFKSIHPAWRLKTLLLKSKQNSPRIHFKKIGKKAHKKFVRRWSLEKSWFLRKFHEKQEQELKKQEQIDDGIPNCNKLPVDFEKFLVAPFEAGQEIQSPKYTVTQEDKIDLSFNEKEIKKLLISKMDFFGDPTPKQIFFYMHLANLPQYHHKFIY